MHQVIEEVSWQPPDTAFRDSNLARFARVNGFDPCDYDTLHRWSVASKGEFWRAVWAFADVIGEPGETVYLEDLYNPMTKSTFFPAGKLNLAENLLRGDPGDVAVIATDEAGGYVELTLAELRRRVGQAIQGLLDAGVTASDCVAGILPNRVEALVALLATAAIGATWTSCSPDFGSSAILDRLGQTRPKVLFASLTYRYGGKDFDISERIFEVLSGIESLSVVVVTSGRFPSGLPDRIILFDMRSFGRERPPIFNRVSFSHPAYVLYTSGTTGAPKAIVHSVGGVLLEHLKEHLLHGDVRPKDVVFWYTNTAWMMYHWMVSALGCRATIVLYDGAPILKSSSGLDVTPLWKLADRAKITHFGTSPKYLSTVADSGYSPGQIYNLEALKSVLLAGAPVSSQLFDWSYDHIKRDMIFASISGGTEIIGCFLLGSPLHPVRRGHLTVKSLGLSVAVMDGRNASVIGRQGDLVCTEPVPSMPLTFAGEGGYQRYLETYFGSREEIWTHGDIAEMTIFGSAIIHGRADTTLKPGGVRIGTAEIYSACESFREIEDCLVFGVSIPGDEEVVLCLKLREDADLTVEFASQLRSFIRENISPRHVPHRIHAVGAIPYTINGKRVESAARTVFEGRTVKNLASIANPESLDEYRRLDRENSV